MERSQGCRPQSRGYRSMGMFVLLHWSIMQFYSGLITHLWLVMDINRRNIIFVVLCSFVMTMSSCKMGHKSEYVVPAAEIDSMVRRMSDLMVHDVTTAPEFSVFQTSGTGSSPFPLLWRYPFYGCQHKWTAARRKDRKICIDRIFQGGRI